MITANEADKISRSYTLWNFDLNRAETAIENNAKLGLWACLFVVNKHTSQYVMETLISRGFKVTKQENSNETDLMKICWLKTSTTTIDHRIYKQTSIKASNLTQPCSSVQPGNSFRAISYITFQNEHPITGCIANAVYSLLI